MFRKRTGQSVAECRSANWVRLRGESSSLPAPRKDGAREQNSGLGCKNAGGAAKRCPHSAFCGSTKVWPG